MRVAFVVQRCGQDVNGGAEQLCLQVAQRMNRFWDVEVLTTCALDYMTWDNYYPSGLTSEAGINIRRFEVDAPRDVARFDFLSQGILQSRRESRLADQEEWMRAQGPFSSELFSYLQNSRDDYGAFIFFGYLYATTYFGLPLVAEKAVLAPLGHDEWPIHLSMWDRIFAQPSGFIFQTPEELTFLQRRFQHLNLAGPVAGVGVDPPSVLRPDVFRAQYNLHQPFLLYVGRIDASKGCGDMFEWFIHRRASTNSDLKLVLIGREVLPIPFHDDLIYLGFVSEQEKWNAMAACDWLLLPSAYESLSLSLLETWTAGRPVIVNAASEVLRGHCRRSHGGIWYENWREVESALKLLDNTTKSQLGAQGAAYVRANYTWDTVEAAYLETVAHREHSKLESAASPITLRV